MNGIHTEAPETEEISPYWDDLAWGSLVNLGITSEPHPGSDKKVLGLWKRLLHAIKTGCPPIAIYVNPCFRVWGSPTRDFLKAITAAKRAWWTRLNSAPFPIGRQLKHTKGLLRQAIFTGILLIDGRHIQPQDWASRVTGAETLQELRERCPHLNILSLLPKGRCRFRCVCERTWTARRSHLVRGSTTSCGCLNNEMMKRREFRKRQRCRS